MSYESHYRMLDDIAHHLDRQAADRTIDEFLKSRYTGFFAVSAAACLEMVLKEIVVKFAGDAHPLFGEYVISKYGKINGRISIDSIRGEHISPFGSAYQNNFDAAITKIEKYAETRWRTSIKGYYKTMLSCRHKFAHEGVVPAHVTYEEVKRGYAAGKAIMRCVAKSLR